MIAARTVVWVVACLIGTASSRVFAQPEVVTSTPAHQHTEWTADPAAPFLSFDRAWPARWGRDDLNGMGVIVVRDATPARMTMFRIFANRKPSPTDLADLDSLAGIANKDEFSFESFGAIVFDVSKSIRRIPALNEGPSLGAGPDTGEVFVFVSARGDAPKRLIDRTYFAYYPPCPSKRGEEQPPLRAVALLMPGLLGMPETTIDPFTRMLRTSGIGVLRMLCQPARFTEQIKFTIDPDKPEAAAAEVARCFTDRTAECAYAVEAAWRYVEEAHPEVRNLPRLAIGLSGGAMTLPTIVARDPKRYVAAVLIGGGCDFWLINERSNYRMNVNSVRCVWKGATPREEQLKNFDRLYLENAPLDSFHTAPALKSVKILMIHGEQDRAVPAELGDLLWQRLGKPERWSYPASHEILCGLLPTEFGKLRAWIEGAVWNTPAIVPASPTTKDSRQQGADK